jgi:hypothetical protein
MVRVPKPALYKTIFQARYKAELKFYELLMPAAQRLHEYSHCETDRLRVTLRDFDTHCSVAIAHDSFSYEQDSQDTAMEEKYPDVAVFMDLDLYQESERLQTGEAAPFVAAAREKLQGLAEDVSAYLFLREVEA